MLVHLDKELRYRGTEKSCNARKTRFLVQRLDKIVDYGRQLKGIRASTALHVNLETTGSAEAADRRRVERDGDAVGLLYTDTGQFLDNILCGSRAFGPVFDRDEHGRRIGFIAAADQIKAIDYEFVGYRGSLAMLARTASAVLVVRASVAPSGKIVAATTYP